jgi:hypothetical protein
MGEELWEGNEMLTIVIKGDGKSFEANEEEAETSEPVDLEKERGEENHIN